MALTIKPALKGNTEKLNSCGINGIKIINNVKYAEFIM